MMIAMPPNTPPTIGPTLTREDDEALEKDGAGTIAEELDGTAVLEEPLEELGEEDEEGDGEAVYWK